MTVPPPESGPEFELREHDPNDCDPDAGGYEWWEISYQYRSYFGGKFSEWKTRKNAYSRKEYALNAINTIVTSTRFVGHVTDNDTLLKSQWGEPVTLTHHKEFVMTVSTPVEIPPPEE